MTLLEGTRRRLRLRQRFRNQVAAKHEAELRWWLEVWNPVLEAGGFNPGDVPALLGDEPFASTYIGLRWQQARAEVRRVLKEASITDEHYFDGKVVVDIGPGPLGFPDACPARISIGVDPLADLFKQHELLLPDSPAIYLATGAERIPLVSASVDVVVARNSLDHVDDPEAVLSETQRLLRPGGSLIVNFDIGHTPTTTEPHALTVERVRSGLPGLAVVHEEHMEVASGADGHAVVLVARKP